MTAQGVDWIIPCPYCGIPSHLHTVGIGPDGGLVHHCQMCGPRELGIKEVAIAWARGEAVAERLRDEGIFYSETAIEPMFRDAEGRWYGVWTRERIRPNPVPAGCCDRFGRDDRYYRQEESR